MKSKRKTKNQIRNALLYRLGEATEDANIKQSKYLAGLRKVYRMHGVPVLRKSFRDAQAVKAGILAKLASIKNKK